MAVSSDWSPTEPALQSLDGRRNILKLSAKNVKGSADWERCAKEFACDWSGKTWFSPSVTGKRLEPCRKSLVSQGANVQFQPKAKKRLASSLASEVLPPKLSGKCECVFRNVLLYVLNSFITVSFNVKIYISTWLMVFYC